MDKDKSVIKLDDNDESQIVGGRAVKHFHAKYKPRFRHPIRIDSSLILVKRSKLSGETTATPVLEQ